MAKQKKSKNLSKEQKYERQKLLNAARVRKYREKMSQEQLDEKRKKDRERYYKKKEQNLVKSINDLTDREKRKKRKTWKVNSKNYRLRKKRESCTLQNTPPTSDEDIENVTVESVQKKRGRKIVKRDRATAYRTIHKQNKKIENLERLVKKYQKRIERIKAKETTTFESPSPNKKVNSVLGKEKVSPGVKKRLFLGYVLEKQLKSIKTKTSPKSKTHQLVQKVIGTKVLRKYRVQTHFSKIISYKTNRLNESNLKYERKKHVSKAKATLNKKIVAFYEDDSVSKMCPGKRDFVRKGRLKVQRRILLDTLKKLHQRFVEESGCDIPYSSFVRARPFWVTHPKAADRDTCACIVHSNTDLMVVGLYNIKAIKSRTAKDALESILCSLKNRNCLTGKCKVCLNKKIPFNEDLDGNINLKIHQWKIIQEKKLIKGEIKMVKRMIKERQVIKLSDAKQKLLSMMVRFKVHVSNLMHQAAHKKQTKKNLSSRELMILLDFSENYVAKYKSEVQSMHFGASKKQISLHTVVCYFNDGEEIVPRSFCTVSNNLAHQAFAVWSHLDLVLEILSKEFPQTLVVHFYSDSPSSQYRNRTNLYLLKKLVVNYFPLLQGVTWNYSEPGHGKGPMDGIGGTLKRRADELVLHGNDISSASDFQNAFRESKITVMEVKDKKFLSIKKSLPTVIAPVPQITKMKQVTYCIQENKMFGRTLSCAKCPYNEKCVHFNLNEIFAKSNSQKKQISSNKLRVGDVWSSSEEDDVASFLSVPRTSITEDQVPGPSNSKTGCDVKVTSKIDINTFVLVRFEQQSRSSNTHQFVGVVQEFDDSDIKVTFLKPAGVDKTLFLVDEQDTAYIATDQVVAVLPQPTIVMRGTRVYHKFKRAVPVF